MSQRNWTEQNASGTKWKPMMTEDNGMKMSKKKEDNQLEGYYANQRELPGKENKTFKVYSIQTVNPDGTLGEVKDVAGGKILDDLMDTVKQGSFVLIEYGGRKHKQGKSGPFTQTNSYHIWKLFTDPTALPMDQLKSGAKNENASVSTKNDTDSAATSNNIGNQYAGASVDDYDDLPF